MTITYQEVEREIRNEVMGDKNYAEIKNGNISVVVQMAGADRWRVQFYHVDSKLIVLAEHLMDNDDYTLRLIHEALVFLENGTHSQVIMLNEFTQNLVVVREEEQGTHVAEFYPMTGIKEYMMAKELFLYDPSVKTTLDGNGYYPVINDILKKYGIDF